MASLLEDKQDAIAMACKRYHVARMSAFGSVLRSDYQPGVSDVDLLVEFTALPPFELVDAYFGLLEELMSIQATPVDLVMADAIKNPYVIASIDSSKCDLYVAR
jgi:predicted nucleotidyltransferase